MNLGFIGKLLFEGELERLKKELLKTPLTYEDVRLVRSVLNAIDTNDELSLFRKVAQNEHEVPKEERLQELLERLEESLRLSERVGGETDKLLARRLKQLIELLGPSIGFRFPGEERFLGVGRGINPEYPPSPQFP